MIEYEGGVLHSYHGTLTLRMEQAFQWEAARTGKPIHTVLWLALRAEMHRIEQEMAAAAQESEQAHGR